MHLSQNRDEAEGLFAETLNGIEVEGEWEKNSQWRTYFEKYYLLHFERWKKVDTTEPTTNNILEVCVYSFDFYFNHSKY